MNILEQGIIIPHSMTYRVHPPPPPHPFPSPHIHSHSHKHSQSLKMISSVISKTIGPPKLSGGHFGAVQAVRTRASVRRTVWPRRHNSPFHRPPCLLERFARMNDWMFVLTERIALTCFDCSTPFTLILDRPIPASHPALATPGSLQPTALIDTGITVKKGRRHYTLAVYKTNVF